MSTTDATKRTAGSPAPVEEPDPQPWRAPEDVEGWGVVAQGRGKRRQPPLMRLVVDLDTEQSAWVRAEAQRTGLDYIAVVKRLVEKARRTEARAKKSAS
jgi:hypothetical protein